MTGNDNTFDLSISGSNARQVAKNLLTLVDGDEEYDTADVRVEMGDCVIEPSATGQNADELVSTMLSGFDWGEYSPTHIEVRLRDSGSDEPFEPPEDPEYGERVSEWIPSEVEAIDIPASGSRRYAVLGAFSDNGPMTAKELAEVMEIGRGEASSVLSYLFTKAGLLDRAKAHRDTGGQLYLYRLNDHGRAAIGE